LNFQCLSALQVGFDGWLAKPFRVEEFARVLSKYKELWFQSR